MACRVQDSVLGREGSVLSALSFMLFIIQLRKTGHLPVGNSEHRGICVKVSDEEKGAALALPQV